MRTYFLFICLFVYYSCSEENISLINDIPFGTEESLDIVTWNIENFPKHSSTIDYVADFILSLNADVIALQEISNQSDFNSLLDILGDPWTGYISNDGDYQTLAYIINTDYVNVLDIPYTILDEYSYFFAYRDPYVLNIEFDNEQYSLINIHLKCCGDGLLQNNDSDEEYRRLKSSQYLKEYVDYYFEQDQVIILGDFNDELVDDIDNNVFLNFFNDENYYFSDIYIAEGPSSDWSYPGWPSHLDHLLFFNYPIVDSLNTNTLLLDNYMIGGWDKYDNYVSDHRPVGVSIPRIPN